MVSDVTRTLTLALALVVSGTSLAATSVSTPQTETVQGPALEASNTNVAEPGLLEDLEPTSNPVIVQFDDTVPTDLEARYPGLEVVYRFQSLPAVFARAPAEMVQALAEAPAVDYVEDAAKPIGFDLDTATEATRAKEVWEPAYEERNADRSRPPITADGSPIDGSGIGIAVVDSGVDGLHPDFRTSDKLARNMFVTPAGMIDSPHTSPHSNHGTAVAGVAAGNGAASDGEFRGAAPGASLYSLAIQPVDEVVFSTGVGSVGNSADAYTLYPAIAFDWILQNGQDQDPPIKVVSNAWHCQAEPCQEFNPNQIHNQLASDLAEAGYVLTWATGELRPKTEERGINPEATNPTPGIISAASYDDAELGIQEGCPSGSAEGFPDQPTTWPDVSAPGIAITTTKAVHAKTSTVDRAFSPYAKEYGSSLAAGHVAGVAALVLQANPELHPSQVEYLLKDTAVKLPEDRCEAFYVRADPAHPWDGSNFDAGHGLVDAYASVENATTFDGIPDPVATEPVPDEFLDLEDRGVNVQERLYLAEDGRLATERPEGSTDETFTGQANEEITFTTEPFDSSRTIDGIDASVWVAVHTEALTEAYGDFLTSVGVTMTLEQIDENGNLVDSLQAKSDFPWTPTMRDRERSFVLSSDDLGTPLEIDQGDTLRVSIGLDASGLTGEETAPDVWTLHWGSENAPSHVGLGQSFAPMTPGGYAECRYLGFEFCAWLDADHPRPQWSCETHGLFVVEWTGPPGSSATVQCYGAIASCEIPEDHDAPLGTCREVTHWVGGLGGNGPHHCSFTLPEGYEGTAYHGKCETVAD